MRFNDVLSQNYHDNQFLQNCMSIVYVNHTIIRIDNVRNNNDTCMKICRLFKQKQEREKEKSFKKEIVIKI